MKRVLAFALGLGLGGCYVQLDKSYKMVAVSSSATRDAYVFRAGTSRVLVIDTVGAFQFGDSIELRRK